MLLDPPRHRGTVKGFRAAPRRTRWPSIAHIGLRIQRSSAGRRSLSRRRASCFRALRKQRGVEWVAVFPSRIRGPPGTYRSGAAWKRCRQSARRGPPVGSGWCRRVWTRSMPLPFFAKDVGIDTSKRFPVRTVPRDFMLARTVRRFVQCQRAATIAGLRVGQQPTHRLSIASTANRSAEIQRPEASFRPNWRTPVNTAEHVRFAGLMDRRYRRTPRRSAPGRIAQRLDAWSLLPVHASRGV